MKIIRDFTQAKELLTRSLPYTIADDMPSDKRSPDELVREIILNVKRNGDRALFDYTRKFDGASLKSLEVSAGEIKQAVAAVKKNRDLYSSMSLAARRIRSFHKTCMLKYGRGFLKNGLGQQITPIERVGIYVPGGTAAYPSTVLMTAIPARVAGVREIIMVTPCGKDGRVPDNTLAAASIAGVDRIFKVGGAQAVAALALGTESIPKVDKICGPGNIFVMTAKKLVYGMVDIDALQGPSEVVVIADSGADPAFCAADLIAQSEHDAMASSIFITTSQSLCAKVQKELDRQLAALKRGSIAQKALDDNGLMVTVKNLDQAVELANLYAPEHLSLMVRDADKHIAKIRNAGCICAGDYSPVVLGDYVAGPSHALPTGGSARFSSPLVIQDFLKISSIIALDRDDIKLIGPAAEIMAANEGLTGHAGAVSLRLNRKR